MKNKKLFWISTISCLIPIIIAILFYRQLPEQIPIHWNAAGEIDGYANKLFALFGLPLGMMFLHIMVLWMMDKDPKHKNIPVMMYHLMYFVIPVLTTIIILFSINASLPYGIDINVTTILPLIIGLLFLLIGNYMPKCKQSYTVGIKTPWALDDEENWNKTHRLGGFLWIIGGLLIMFSGFLPSEMTTPYILIALIPMTIIPYVYSYLLYKKKKGK